jgi:hypothetical protein
MARQKLSSSRQSEDESVDEFVQRLNPLINLAHPVKSPQEKKEVFKYEFLNKLKPDIAFYVRIAHTHNQSFEEIHSKALEVENMLSHRKSLDNVQIKSMNIDPKDSNPDFDPQYDPNPPNYTHFPDGSFHPRPIICWNCDEAGHKHFECPYQEQFDYQDEYQAEPGSSHSNNYPPSNLLSQFSTDELLEELRNRPFRQ